MTSYRFTADDALPAFLPGQFLTLRVAGRRRSGARAHLLPVGRPGRRLPDQREERVARSGQRPSPGAPAARRPVEVAAPAWRLRAGGRRTSPCSWSRPASASRRCWRCCTGSRAREHARGVVDAHDPRRRHPRLRRRGRRPAPSAAVGSLLRVLHLPRRAARRATRGSRPDASPPRWSPGSGLPTDATAYICGPEGFMDDVTAALADAGLDPARIHTERFGSRSAINPGVVRADTPPPHQPSGPPGAGPAGHVRPIRAHDPLVGRLRLGARARRGLRRADSVVVPHRRVPHLRDRGAVR